MGSDCISSGVLLNFLLQSDIFVHRRSYGILSNLVILFARQEYETTTCI